MAKNYSRRRLTLFFIFFALLFSVLFLGLSYLQNQEAEKRAAKSGNEARLINEACLRQESKRVSEDTWSRKVCYAREMEKIAYRYGSLYARGVMTKLQEIDPDSRSCHIIAHGIGWGVYKSAPDKMRESIAKSSFFCDGGEQHGIIEKYIESIPEGGLTQDNIGEICGRDPKADCNRMVGHMILVETQNDMDKAIGLCGGLYDEEQEFICYGGLMMERFIGYNLIEHGIIPNQNLSEKLFEFKEYCDTLKGDVEIACWQGLAHPAYYYFDKDPQKVLEFCDSATLPEAAIECKVHALSELTHVNKISISESGLMCELSLENDPVFKKQCLMELVSLYLRPDIINSEQVEKVSHFCLNLSISYREDCFSSIGYSLDAAYILEEQIENYCSKYSGEYFNSCFNVSK